MSSFSPQSLIQLSTCDQRLQTVFQEVIKYVDCQILEGHRGEAAQEAAFAAGKSKLHFPYGKHNATPSLAVDVAPFPIDWSDIRRFHLFAGFVLGIGTSLGINLRWGGDWNGTFNPKENTFADLPHFEIRS